MARTLHRLIALAVVATTSAFLPQGPRKAPCAALKSVADKAAATVPIAVEAGDAPSVAAWRAACDETGVVSFHDFGLRVGEAPVAAAPAPKPPSPAPEPVDVAYPLLSPERPAPDASFTPLDTAPTGAMYDDDDDDDDDESSEEEDESPEPSPEPSPELREDEPPRFESVAPPDDFDEASIGGDSLEEDRASIGGASLEAADDAPTPGASSFSEPFADPFGAPPEVRLTPGKAPPPAADDAAFSPSPFGEDPFGDPTPPKALTPFELAISRRKEEDPTPAPEEPAEAPSPPRRASPAKSESADDESVDDDTSEPDDDDESDDDDDESDDASDESGSSPEKAPRPKPATDDYLSRFRSRLQTTTGASTPARRASASSADDDSDGESD